jgi:tetratricopeptide (TPR) repeat protein
MGWYGAGLSLVATVWFAARHVAAEGEIQVTAPPNIIENPFVGNKPKPRTVAVEPQATRRGPTTYQNPFAQMSKAPPVDSPVRPGPMSRWRRPTLPHEPSAIKAAVLSPSTKSAGTSWDQLPPAEKLRERAATLSAPTDTTLYDRLSGFDPTIRFNPAPLAQPNSIIAEVDEPEPIISSNRAPSLPPLNPTPITDDRVVTAAGESATNDPHQITNVFAVDPIAAAPAQEQVSSTIVSDCADTPEEWLAQAQQAATSATSAEELTTVIELCDRGIRGTPPEKVLSSLRRLSAWAYNRRGELMADAERADEAIHDFQVAITMDTACSLAIHNRAVTLAQRNQFAAALRDFNRVIELNPGLAVAYRNRAELLAALGRMDEAVADYTQALESLPDDAALLRARSHAYQRLGDFSRATTDLTRALQLEPKNPDVFTQRGGMAAEQGNFEQAQEDFRRALAIDPSWVDAHRSLAWLQATCPDKRFRNAEQALASAEKAAELSPPDDYLILDTLAAAHACAGNFQKAVAFEKKSLASAPAEVATSLNERLMLYQRDQAYSTAPAPSDVRPASHEAPAADSSSWPSPNSSEPSN